MTTGTTLFQLNLDKGQAFDGSAHGIAVLNVNNAKALPGDTGFQVENGHLELARNAVLDNLQTFTIKATILPSKVGGARHNIVEAQTPAIAFFIESTGKLTGSVHTAKGWESVDSGNTLVKQGVAGNVEFTRETNGQMALQINGVACGSKLVPGPITSVGTAGFKIGSGADGKAFPFVGNIHGVQIIQGVVTAQVVSARNAASQQILTEVKKKATSSRITVNLEPDPSMARLQQVRNILDAAGVNRLSDLSTLRINTPTVMTRGKILVAPKASTGTTVQWGAIAKEVATGNAATVRTRLAQYLTNRNSSSVLTKMTAATAPAVAAAKPAAVTPAATAAHAPAVALSAAVAKPALALQSTLLTHALQITPTETKLLDASLLDRIHAAAPVQWPMISAPAPRFLFVKTIPIDSAVIIAHTLDLTQTRLLVDPAVTKLYIIAEEVICGPNASITWAQPGGSTPPRLDNPDLNGRGWSGVQTKPDSRNGLDGASARSGESGIDGARGRNAPSIEMWVKTMTAIPNVDLDGENGRKAGTGQRGGAGGSGGDGHGGEKWWFFGWHCWSGAGDGGDGGDGGNGGPGGRGGNGGNGADITIGTLQGTLASTVTSKSFKMKNQGGQTGDGGDGGQGGLGGRGGRSGNGEVCTNARNGHNGAQGQPGRAGNKAQLAGADGQISFFEFSEDAWNQLLTRPWLSQLTPTDAFPGDTLTLRGSAFTTNDRVILDGTPFTPTVNLDQSISITIPLTIDGGAKSITVRRQDGTESNRLTVNIKPQLDAFTVVLSPGVSISLTGHAFENGASVLIDGTAAPATVAGKTNLSFNMPGTGGSGSAGGTVTVQVRNPDGFVSNSRSATKPLILEIPFAWGVNNYTFPNFTQGAPSWGTFEDTFGTAEVWHELLDPIFGHPILTAAFFGFYTYFLKGKGHGGLATGFCTSLASTVADNLWSGRTDTHLLTEDGMRTKLTAIHGKLLSRESLLHFHDQGREGISRIEKTAREIEATFLRGCDRQNAPILFFIPSGEIWDSGYFDKLSDSHCVMPWRFVYPKGHPGPKLSADGTTTIDDLDGVQLFVWDCNHPSSQNCRLEFSKKNGQLVFKYFPDSGSPEFTSDDGITLGEWTNGDYNLADHDLPFSGPLGLTTFVIDFLLSPADLQVTNETGARTGSFGNQILSEIPGSHPCYLMKNMYMLPVGSALTRKITGNGTGTYTYTSVMPDHGSLVLENVATVPGHEDHLAVSADGTQVRFTPAADKTFNLTICRNVNGQARALAITGAGAAPGADVDLTVSPDLSLVRMGNRSSARTVDVRAFAVDKVTKTPQNQSATGVNLPTQHDLVVAVPDWSKISLAVQAVSFE
ncbi:MAG: hypothetical protein DMG65_14615 [Candidatus Angelobacter sp. Gp1-AA117]|nr:MAG: hypothetical protein DMG65_14615 [Candidatus Angelobacter sp. Gp1-AA117]